VGRVGEGEGLIQGHSHAGVHRQGDGAGVGLCCVSMQSTLPFRVNPRFRFEQNVSHLTTGLCFACECGFPNQFSRESTTFKASGLPKALMSRRSWRSLRREMQPNARLMQLRLCAGAGCYTWLRRARTHLLSLLDLSACTCCNCGVCEVDNTSNSFLNCSTHTKRTAFSGACHGPRSSQCDDVEPISSGVGYRLTQVPLSCAPGQST
jgi:hypothetical protein